MATVSVIICTRNRAELLPVALDSLLLTRAAPNLRELLLVDNGSSDSTKEVIDAYAPAFAAKLRYVYEPTVGLSTARNRGARESTGDILAYLDDDVVVDGRWLDALVDMYQTYGDQLAAVGGLARLHWEAPPAPWLSTALYSYLSTTEQLGTQPRLLGPTEYPVGANFSVRRDALQEIGYFNEALTRFNDEIDVVARLRLHGYVVGFQPFAIVAHRVIGERVTRRYFLRRAYWQGVSDILVEQQSRQSSHLELAKASAAVTGQMMVDFVRFLQKSIQRTPAGAFVHLFSLAGRWGRVHTQLHLLRN